MSVVYSPVTYVDVTLSSHTSALDANDVAADTQVVTDALPFYGQPGILQSLTLLDGDDQTAAAVDVYILSSNVSLGTEGSAISITDANAASILGVVSIGSSDWKDLIASKLANINNIGMIVKPAANSRDLYVAMVVAGTPTYTASGQKLRLGFI